MFCSKCGKEINDEAVICVHCGCAVKNNTTANNITRNEHEWLVAMLLCWFLGGFGAHRFYTGHIGTGIVQLITLGGCGLWAFIDWVCMCFNAFRDIDNRPLNNYKKEVGTALFAVGIVISILVVVVAIAVGDIE